MAVLGGEWQCEQALRDGFRRSDAFAGRRVAALLPEGLAQCAGVAAHGVTANGGSAPGATHPFTGVVALENTSSAMSMHAKRP
ncbi:hypothetical protein GCM10027564_26350 [Luteimonas notoginsengisoli]